MTKMERQTWQVVIAAPIETVWNTLVKTDEVLPFLFGGICDTADGLKVGRPMRMVTKDGKFAIAYGEVLEFSPPYRFSHAINFAMAADEAPGITTYELKEVAGGTELTLISEAIPATQTAKMNKSGQFIVDNLKAQVETGGPTFAGRIMMLMSPLMGLFMPKHCRAENFPLSSVPLRGDGTAAASAVAQGSAP